MQQKCIYVAWPEILGNRSVCYIIYNNTMQLKGLVLNVQQTKFFKLFALNVQKCYAT